MKNKFKVLPVILAFVIGFTFGTTVKFLYESTSFRPYTWPKNRYPIVVNCYGDDFNKLQFVRAVEYWALRGELIGFYEHEPSQSICENDWLEGFIILKKSEELKYHKTTLASTKRYTSLASMKGAVINYKPGAYNLNLINEHELGHALGFTHVEIEGHIMHPLYHKMGRNFWIPS